MLTYLIVAALLASQALAEKVLFKGEDMNATYFYDNTNQLCDYPMGPGWAHVTGMNSHAPFCDNVGFNITGTNRVVALNWTWVRADPHKWCGREVRVTKSSGEEFKFEEGSLFIWDSCEACGKENKIDFSGKSIIPLAKAIVAINPDGCAKNAAGLKVEVLDTYVTKLDSYDPPIYPPGWTSALTPKWPQPAYITPGSDDPLTDGWEQGWGFEKTGKFATTGVSGAGVPASTAVIPTPAAQQPPYQQTGVTAPPQPGGGTGGAGGSGAQSLPTTVLARPGDAGEPPEPTINTLKQKLQVQSIPTSQPVPPTLAVPTGSPSVVQLAGQNGACTWGASQCVSGTLQQCSYAAGNTLVWASIGPCTAT